MPPKTRKKARKVGKTQERPGSPKPSPPKLSVRAARLRVAPTQLSPRSSGLPSGNKASSILSHRKATKSTRTSVEKERLGAGDQPAHLAETEEQVPDPAARKPPLVRKRNKRKKARKSSRPDASAAPIDSSASKGKDEKADTPSQVPAALSTRSRESAAQYLAYVGSQGKPLPTTSGSEAVPTDSRPTTKIRLRSMKEQSVRSAIPGVTQQDELRASPAPKRRRPLDDLPAESAKSKHRTKATGVEADKPALERGRGEKATTEARETFERDSPQPGRSKKTPKQKVVTVHSELLPSASAVQMTRALSRSLEDKSSRNAVPGHVKEHVGKVGHASEHQHLSHGSPADVSATGRHTKAAHIEVKEADLEGSTQRKPSSEEWYPLPATRARTAETSSSHRLPKKKGFWDKHPCATAISGGAKSTVEAHLRSPKEQSMRICFSEEAEEHASKQRHPSDDAQSKGLMIREQKNVADVELQHPVLETSGHRKTATGSYSMPASWRETVEIGSPQKLAKRTSDGKKAPVTTKLPPHASARPVTKELSASLNKQSTSRVEKAERSGHSSKQQRHSGDAGAAGIFGAKRRVTVPVDVDGMSPLHLPVFELSRLTRASAPLSSPRSAQLATTAVDVEDVSSLHPLVLESTRISQVRAGRSPCDQVEKRKESNTSPHRQKRQLPAMWEEWLVLDSTHGGEKEPSRRNRAPSLERRESVSPVPPGPAASDASVADGGRDIGDLVTPWYEQMFGKRGTGEPRTAFSEEPSEDDDVESVHWKVDYEEPSCRFSDSSSELSIESDDYVLNAFENDYKFSKLVRQSDHSRQSHEEAQRLERRRKDTRKRVQQFLSGIKVTKGAFEAFEQCEELMMEHMQQSVEALAKHAGRQRVEDLDIITFIQRYLGTSDPTKLMALAEELLPREQCRRLFPPTPNALLAGKAKNPSQW
ncbi:uncharacterized protein LOC144098813 isoform X1 [Amblyomma americanum]